MCFFFFQERIKWVDVLPDHTNLGKLKVTLVNFGGTLSKMSVAF